MNLPLAVLLIFAGVLSVESSAGVCSRQRLENRTRMVSHVVYVSEVRYYSIACGFWHWDRCRRSRTVQVSRTVYIPQNYVAYRRENYCCPGYTGTGRNCRPVCRPECGNGTCTDPNLCSCSDGYSGHRCEQPECSPECQNGGDCYEPGKCHCTTGWSGERCEEAECQPACANGGHCVIPGHCACPSNWTGARCDEGTCSGNECLHGDCNGDNTCTCHQGWYGARCEKAICFPPDGCQNSGHCVTPGHCSCADGYSGAKCDQAECTVYCLHGTCEGNTCRCHIGWTGSSCNEAVCHPPCQNGGTCVFPGTCSCPVDYDGYRCETPPN